MNFLSFIFRRGKCYTYCPQQILQEIEDQRFSMYGEKTNKVGAFLLEKYLSESMIDAVRIFICFKKHKESPHVSCQIICFFLESNGTPIHVLLCFLCSLREAVKKKNGYFTVRLAVRGGGSTPPGLTVAFVKNLTLFSMEYDSLILKTHFT